MPTMGLWARQTAWILLVLGLSGCATNIRTSVVLPSSAYFAAEPAELKQLQAIAKIQEARMKNCGKSAVLCEEAYYTRGLVALFENRADAINFFQELHTTMSNGRYAASSLRWLSLLQDNSLASKHNSMLFAQLRQEVLNGLLEREEPAISRRMKEAERKVADLGR
jgi:hypothetical protein